MSGHFWSPSVNSPFGQISQYASCYSTVSCDICRDKDENTKWKNPEMVSSGWVLPLAANSAGDVYSLVYIVLYHDCVIDCLLNFWLCLLLCLHYFHVCIDRYLFFRHQYSQQQHCSPPRLHSVEGWCCHEFCCSTEGADHRYVTNTVEFKRYAHSKQSEGEMTT